MPNYTVDALRTIRVIQRTHEKAGHSVQADQMRQIGDQVEAMQAELYDWQERANEHANNSAAATTELIGLRAELAALKESVEWERECQSFTYRKPLSVDAMKELLRTRYAARAEVDRLLENES